MFEVAQLRSITADTVQIHRMVEEVLRGLVGQENWEELQQEQLPALLPRAQLAGAAGLSFAERLEAPRYHGQEVDEDLLRATGLLRYIAQRLLLTAAACDAPQALALIALSPERLAELTADPQARALLALGEPPSEPRPAPPQLIDDEFCRHATEEILRDTFDVMRRCGQAMRAGQPQAGEVADLVVEGWQTAATAMRFADTMDDGHFQGVPSDPDALGALPLLRYLAERLLMTAVASNSSEYVLMVSVMPPKARALHDNPVARAALKTR